MFFVYTEVTAQDDTVTFNKTTLHFQLLPMSKVDQSLLRIHEVPPLQLAKSQVVHIAWNRRRLGPKLRTLTQLDTPSWAFTGIFEHM